MTGRKWVRAMSKTFVALIVGLIVVAGASAYVVLNSQRTTSPLSSISAGSSVTQSVGYVTSATETYTGTITGALPNGMSPLALTTNR